ncbi:ABC transporter [Xylogone sp. PMI_703]|nr:ABC transporter [Xylogone sp. PMI_703]
MSQQLHVTCPRALDNSFGPWAGDSCRGGFDFTLLFEEAILTVPLQCALLLVLPIRVYALMPEKSKVVASRLRYLKLSFSICLITLTAALLALLNVDADSRIRTRATVPTAALVFVSSLGIGLLSWLEHERSIRPSFIVSTYLFLRVVMYILESTGKRSILFSSFDLGNLAKETTSSTLSRLSFLWLTPLFLNGYKNTLALEDLYPLDSSLQAEALHAPLSTAWTKAPDKEKFGALWATWHRVFIRPMLAPVIPRLFQTGFTYAQPFLVNTAVALAYTPEEQPFNNYGYSLIGAYFLVYMGIAISTGQYEWRVYRAASMMKGSVAALIYENSLHLSITSPSVRIVEIAIAIYLIARQLGAASAMPISLAVVVMISTFILAVPTGTAQAAWIQASQNRVTATSKLLGNIKSIKASGLSNIAFDIIRQARTEELRVSRKCRLLLGSALILAEGSSTLTISRAFTSYALFILVNKPLSDIIIALPMIATSVASFQRIQDHMKGKERIDIRTTAHELITDKRKPSKLTRPMEKTRECYDALDQDVLEEFSTPQANEKLFPKDVIASVHGKFSWKVGDKPVIDIDNWMIHRQKFTIVLGAVGCGKSTLLKSLLGELSTFDGMIHVDCPRVAYSAQNPWLPNDTVRNIIAGPGDIDEPWYQAVPMGDKTVTGSKGVSVSVGQKHRLSIARALYSGAELLILDDCFSGLDAATENTIFHNLLGKDGLVRTARMTIVVASSIGQRAFYADQVVLLNDEGQISNSGTPEELSEILAQSSEDGRWSELIEPTVVETADMAVRPAASALPVIEPVPERDRRLGRPDMYPFYARSAGIDTLSIFLGAMIVFTFCNAFPTMWLNWWAESNATNPNGELGKWLGVYVALGVGASIAALIAFWIAYFSNMYDYTIVILTLDRAPMSFYTKVNSGMTVNRFSQDLQLIDMEFPSTALGVAVGVSFIAADFIMIAITSRYMAIFLPILIIIRLLDIELRAPFYSHLIQTLDGLASIRAFRWEDDFTAKNMRLLNNSQKANYLLCCIQRWLTFVADVVIAIIAVVLIAITTSLRSWIGPGYVGVAVSSILGLNASVKATLTSWVMLEVALGAVARIRTYSLTTESEDKSNGALIELKDENWPTEGAVELNGVTASYKSSVVALSNVSMVIQPGERVALCGRTGSGKTSLTLCLLRMMELEEGTITINGVDMSTLAHEYVRSRLISVPQDSYTFDATIRVNIDPAKTASDEEITLVLDKVHLLHKVEENGGLDAVMSENFFSQGEAQLFVFARAMLRKSKILILDEASSSNNGLNDESSKIISDLLMTWFEEWTVIAVVHKFNTIFEYDKVGVLDAGLLKEFDTPSRLLERKNSLFRALYSEKAHDIGLQVGVQGDDFSPL